MAGQQNVTKPEPLALSQTRCEHSRGVTLPPPGFDNVETDMAAGLAQLRCEAMWDHEGSDVSLAPDVPIQRRRHMPPDADAGATGDKGVEVLCCVLEPLRGLPSSAAIRPLSSQE